MHFKQTILTHSPSHDSNSCPSSSRPSLDHAVRDNEHVQLNKEKELRWNSQSPDHPRNWPTWRKIQTATVVCWLEFFMTAISTSGAATANEAKKEYNISTTMSYFAFISIYLIGQLIGGIFCSPISEVFGRRTIYGIGTALFCVSSVVVAAPRSLVAVFLGRFFQGVAASIPATVAFGNFNDMYDAHTRVWVVYFYTAIGMTGLVVGPIYASFVTELIGWRWVYYISTIAAGISVILCLFMKESNAAQLLAAKAEKLKKQTGEKSIRTEGDQSHDTSVPAFIKSHLYRPIKMLVTEPLVFFCAALCGIAFGLVYGQTQSLTVVYTASPFNFTTSSSSLAFLALALGIFLDVIPRLYDDYVLSKAKASKTRIVPETKIRSFAIACPALAIGLWIFAWTIPPRVTTVPWPVSMIGLVCIGFALNDFSYVLFGYISDSYGPNAASAASALSITRTVMAAVFPLFTTQMYRGLTNNVATSILAGAATLFCFTPWLFLKYGRRLRHRSNNAQDDEVCLTEVNGHLEGDEGRDEEEGGGHGHRRGGQQDDAMTL